MLNIPGQNSPELSRRLAARRRPVAEVGDLRCTVLCHGGLHAEII
jgi:hypothetical protein